MSDFDFDKFFSSRTDEELRDVVKSIDRARKYKKLMENDTQNKLREKGKNLPMKNCPVSLKLDLNSPEVKKEVYNYISFLKTYSKKDLVRIFGDVGFVPNSTEIKFLLDKFGYNPDVDIRDISKAKILELAGVVYQIITAMKHAQVKTYETDKEMMDEEVIQNPDVSYKKFF